MSCLLLQEHGLKAIYTKHHKTHLSHVRMRQFKFSSDLKLRVMSGVPEELEMS